MSDTEKMTLHHWLSLLSLTCAAFIFNTSEFVPIGLLSDIAHDFTITEAHAGMMISVYAWVVMLLSLPLMMMVSRFELRKLLLSVIAIFVFFQCLSSFATDYYFLMLSRIGVACAHSIFWSIVSPMAVRIVPDCFRSLALSMIVTGTSVAMIFGLPLGRLIGLYIGWRMTFLSVGIFGLLTFIFIYLTLPVLPSRGGISIQKLPLLFRNKSLIVLYILTFLISGSYYVTYSFIEPFLSQIAHFEAHWITTILMIFGAAGILGSYLFSRYYQRNPLLFMLFIFIGLIFCLSMLELFSISLFSIIFLCIIWGISVTAYNVSFQSEVIRHSPAEVTSVSMSIFSGIFNLGIGCGTWVGGMTCTYWSLSSIGYAGSFFAMIALVFWWLVRKQIYSC